MAEVSGFVPAYGLRSKANFRTTLKTGHVPAPGLDIALKNASLLQRAKVLQIFQFMEKGPLRNLRIRNIRTKKKAGPSMNCPAITLRLYYTKKSEITGSQTGQTRLMIECVNIPLRSNHGMAEQPKSPVMALYPLLQDR